MLRYIGKRILIAIPTFLGITVLVYVLSSMAPGTPLEMIFNDPNATAEQMAAMKAKLGLDQPVMIQYFNWLVQLLHGNMGASYRTGHAVWADISERIGPTLLLTMSSLVFSILIAIPLGIMSAYKPYTAWDYISSAFSFIGLLCRTGICISPFCSIEDLPKWRYVRYIRCQNPSDAVTSPIPSNAGPFHPAGRKSDPSDPRRYA